MTNAGINKNMDELTLISDVVTRNELHMLLDDYITKADLINIFGYINVVVVAIVTGWWFLSKTRNNKTHSHNEPKEKESKNEPTESIYKTIGKTALAIFVGVAIIIISELIMKEILKY